MKNNNCEKLLGNPGQIPGEKLFKEILSEQLLTSYRGMLKIISEMKLLAEWRYYNDGKSWLWKITDKKKTVVWISLWESHFKASFYFTEKNRSGIESLAIDKEIKDTFSNTKSTGKLIPITLELAKLSDLENFRKLIDFKLSLK